MRGKVSVLLTRRCRSSRGRTRTTFAVAFLVTEAARLRHGQDTAISRPDRRLGRAGKRCQCGRTPAVTERTLALGRGQAQAPNPSRRAKCRGSASVCASSRGRKRSFAALTATATRKVSSLHSWISGASTVTRTQRISRQASSPRAPESAAQLGCASIEGANARLGASLRAGPVEISLGQY